LTLPSIQSRREAIFVELTLCRQRSLDLWKRIDPAFFSSQAHRDFSPIGWHFGHIAYTEAFWIIEKLAGFPPLYPEYRLLFAADGLPKALRQNLPSPDTIREYLETVRKQVFNYLEVAPVDRQERLWRWLLQHESQHNETIAIVWQLHRFPDLSSRRDPSLPLPKNVQVEIPGGIFRLGSNAIKAQDNERPAHPVELNTFYLDKYPVTCIEYRALIEAGGYRRQELWSPAGWRWLQENPVDAPLYWLDRPERDYHPVCGVSWYEAEAYANFVGKRLPTEEEWEKAASGEALAGVTRVYPWGNTLPDISCCNHDLHLGDTTAVNAYEHELSPYGCADMLGNVWEWTASIFAPYPDFIPYPYRGYSQVYFDQGHRVLRGGSWATRRWGLRNSFRNWYTPDTRQIFAGFRLVSPGSTMID
jgi:gamma-glutamyl hercynylcysteine S-oxide synthase